MKATRLSTHRADADLLPEGAVSPEQSLKGGAVRTWQEIADILHERGIDPVRRCGQNIIDTHNTAMVKMRKEWERLDAIDEERLRRRPRGRRAA